MVSEEERVLITKRDDALFVLDKIREANSIIHDVKRRIGTDVTITSFQQNLSSQGEEVLADLARRINQDAYVFKVVVERL